MLLNSEKKLVGVFFRFKVSRWNLGRRRRSNENVTFEVISSKFVFKWNMFSSKNVWTLQLILDWVHQLGNICNDSAQIELGLFRCWILNFVGSSQSWWFILTLYDYITLHFFTFISSALTCCTGGPGSIPAIGKSKNCNILTVVSRSRHKLVGEKWSQTQEIVWSSNSIQ